MKNRIRRIIAMLLIVVMLLTTAPLTGIDSLFASKASAAYAVGDHIEYGNYPQSKVTDESMLALLEKKAKKWRSYNYYSGSGSWTDGKMEPSDYMFYADIDVDGDGLRDYRAVRIDKYRPYYTGCTSSSSDSYQCNNGYTTGNIYYFKFEPISWRILDPTDGLIMTEKIMDSQAYNNFVLSSGTVPEDGYTAYWGNADKTYYANDYYNSSIRQWLNRDFYNTAFTSSQANNIRKDVTLNNDCYSSSYPQYNSQESNDKIFLLSYEEARTSAYGFSSSSSTYDTARRAQGTDYAKSQSLWVIGSSSYYGNSWWWLRSPGGSSSGACEVYNDGDSHYSLGVNSTYEGVRPACRLSNLRSDISKSDIGNNTSATVDNKVYTNEPVGFIAEKVSGNALISFNPSWFSGNSSVYNHDLAKLTSKFAMLGYAKKAELKNALETIGFTVDEKYIDLKTGIKRNGETDTEEAKKRVNYFIAHKKMTVNGEETTLVFMGLIGSSHNQWYSNFDPGSGSVHNGFLNAKRFITNSSKTGRLDAYFKEHIKNAENVKILITGHSRGAATANLVAADLIDTNRYAAKKDIYTYAYATPNSTAPEYCSGEQYNRIFNFVNPEDFVTKCMPNAWDYGRYGITFTLPSKTNEGGIYSRYYDNMNKRFKEYYGEKSYQPYKEGEKPVYDVVSKLTSTVGSVNDMYLKKMRSGSGLKSTYEFFQNALCPVVADNGADELIGGLKNMLMAWFMPTTSKTFDKVTDFFLKYEGAAMIKSLLSETGVDVASLSVPVLCGTLMSLIGLPAALFTTVKAEQLLSWARNGQNNFSHAHIAQTYAAFIDTMTEEEVKQERASYRHTVNCPVDIEVYEKSTGDLVGKIVNNIIDEDVAGKENAVVMDVDGDSKSFWLPSNGDYEVKLIGNDDGTMDYTVANVDSDLGETERVNFFDVKITDGLTMTGGFEPETKLDDYALEYENGETLEPSEKLSGDETMSFNINVSVEGNGTATESMTVSSGDYVALNAVADENGKFVGWYENGEKISDESELSFVAKSNRELTAKFETEQKEPEQPPQPENPSNNCSCICHKGGISAFFYKIARFFWKLFKTHKYCSCGVAHY